MEINVVAEARANLPCPLVRLIDGETSEVVLAQVVRDAEGLQRDEGVGESWVGDATWESVVCEWLAKDVDGCSGGGRL